MQILKMRHKKVPFEFFYFMMNKKSGEVCSFVSDSHKTVFERFPPEILCSNGAKLHTIGRLDCDTTGLLLLTNDGKISNFLTRPQNKIEKSYFVRIKYAVSKENQEKYTEKIKSGLLLPPEKKSTWQKSAGAEIEWICENECNLTLFEGKFHEVKRIFRALENEVVFLKRVSFAKMPLDESLDEGCFRALSDDEIDFLQKICKNR